LSIGSSSGTSFWMMFQGVSSSIPR
jgi:hypothetical protein